MQRILIAFVILFSLIALSACGGDDGDVNVGIHEAPEMCVPGAVDPCFCADGTVGSQVCNGTGKRYEACQCPDPQEPPVTDAGAEAAPSEDAGEEADVQLQNAILVTLAATNPASRTLCDGEETTIFAFNLINNGDTEQVVTSLKLKRTGVGQVTDFAVGGISGDFISLGIPDANGDLVFNQMQLVIPPYSSRYLAYWVHVLAPFGQGGDQFAIQIPSSDSIVVEGNTKVLGNFPVSGNTFVISSTPCDVSDAGTASLQPGDLIKGSGTTVYYVGEGLLRYVFPNPTTYESWYRSWDGIQSIDDTLLTQIPLGGNVTIRSGTHLVKIQTDPKTYAVTNCGTLHWIESEAVAKELYGVDWKDRVVDVPDAFIVNYTIGDPITAPVHPNGQLIHYEHSTSVYVVWAGAKRRILDQTAFSANRWNEDFAVPTTIDYPDGLPVAGAEPENFWQIACPPVN